ncbi:hypothetical protein AC739_04820 [Planococcus glaciei]|uniref:hypothetical protein n=1 Tax=Planococcus glaciei TaxID=459472 RepID=UPI00069D95BA|nr:hypothetical protein [Planococcus glaciei]KOF11173.1 hypothetical protein AC739_04820 [Planococcus glaciei]
MKKKILIILVLICLVVLGIVGWIAYPFLAFFYFASDSVSDDVAKSYMKEHYNVEITVIDKYSNALELGETTFTAIPKGEENMKFTMVFSTTDDSLISEDYGSAVKANQELDKLDNEWQAIKKLGFTPAKENGEEQALFVFEDFTALNVVPKEKIKAPPLKGEDLDRFYQLAVIVLNGGAKIDNIHIKGSDDEESIQDFVMELTNLNKNNTKEDFYIMLKQQHPELAAYEIQKAWENDVKKIENERFQFQLAGFEKWIFCDLVEENGVCASLQICLEYAKDGLVQSNPHLKNDLEIIFNFIDKNIQPGTVADISLSDGQNEVYIRHDDRKASQNTDELIEALFVE